MRAGAGARGGAEAGFVFVAVLWFLVLIAGMSATFVSVLGQHLRSEAALARNAIAEAAADGAIRLFAFRLATQAPDGRLQLSENGVWFSCQLFDDTLVRVSIQDQDGLVDLNAAPATLLARVLERSLPGSAAAHAVHNILEHRAPAAEAPPLRAGEGAFAALARRLGGQAGFHSPGELRSVLEEDGIAAEELAPLFTTHSHQDGFDPAAASESLLAAFGRSSDVPREFVRFTRKRIYAIIADVGEPDRGRSVRRAVVELLRQPERPFAVRELETVSAVWREEDDATGKERPPCLQ